MFSILPTLVMKLLYEFSLIFCIEARIARANSNRRVMSRRVKCASELFIV